MVLSQPAVHLSESSAGVYRVLVVHTSRHREKDICFILPEAEFSAYFEKSDTEVMRTQKYFTKVQKSVAFLTMKWYGP